MNKRNARAAALENTMSIGALRAMIEAARGRGGMSRVNPAIPLDRALDIYTAAIADRDPAERPAGMMPDPFRAGRMQPTRDALLIGNILRDCAETRRARP